MESGYDTVIDPSFQNKVVHQSTKWNDQFQEAFEMPISTPAERLKRAKQIYIIYEDFVQTAVRYGRIITEELNIPSSSKTISSINVGIAGGQKFFHEGIFFKVATDPHTIYGGDYFSSKAAGHEIKAFNELMACSEKNRTKLRFSMMTTIDYFGHRLIAAAFLPISTNTILYGSPNGGRIIYKENEELNSLIQDIATSLFLKMHIVGEGLCDKPTPLALPADAEGHLGSDGRYYLVDIPRLFPAEREHLESFGVLIPSDTNSTQKNISIARKNWTEQINQLVGHAWIETKFSDQLLICYSACFEKSSSIPLNQRATSIVGSPIYGNAILVRGEKASARGETFYYMLRPELLRECKIPLSSDTYTKFGKNSSNLHEQEVSQLVQYLIHQKIPKFVEWLVENSHQVVSSLHVPYLLHEEGINLRYIGLIYKLIPESSPRLKYNIVGFNMLGRIINDLLQAKLRHLKFDSFEGFKETLAHFFNLVLGRGPESDSFWTNNVPLQLQLKYGSFGFIYDPINDRSFKTLLGHLILFQEMQYYTGVVFKSSCLARFLNKNKTFPYNPLHQKDIVSVEPKVKKWRWSINPVIQESTITETTAKLEYLQEHPDSRDKPFETTLTCLQQLSDAHLISFDQQHDLLFEIESQRTHLGLCVDVFGKTSLETASSVFKLAARYNSINALELAFDCCKQGASIFCEIGPIAGEICLSCLFIVGCVLEKGYHIDSAEVIFKIILNHVEELFDSSEEIESASPVEVELHKKLLYFAKEHGDKVATKYHQQKLNRLNKLFQDSEIDAEDIILSFLDFTNLSGIALDCTNEWKDFLSSRLNSVNGLTPPVRKRLKYNDDQQKKA